MKCKEWIKGFISAVEKMQIDHTEKKYVYLEQALKEDIIYGFWGPPEYKMQTIKGESVDKDASDDIYCFFVKEFSSIVGVRLFANFQLNKSWNKMLRDSTLDWNEDIVSCFELLFMKGTAIQKKNRMKSVETLVNSAEYLKIKQYMETN